MAPVEVPNLIVHRHPLVAGDSVSVDAIVVARNIPTQHDPLEYLVAKVTKVVGDTLLVQYFDHDPAKDKWVMPENPETGEVEPAAVLVYGSYKDILTKKSALTIGAKGEVQTSKAASSGKGGPWTHPSS